MIYIQMGVNRIFSDDFIQFDALMQILSYTSRFKHFVEDREKIFDFYGRRGESNKGLSLMNVGCDKILTTHCFVLR